MNDTPHRLKIARTADGVGVNLNSNYRTLYFSLAMWEELFNMMRTMRATGQSTIQNYSDPPSHGLTVNPPSRVSLEDLA